MAHNWAVRPVRFNDSKITYRDEEMRKGELFAEIDIIAAYPDFGGVTLALREMKLESMEPKYTDTGIVCTLKVPTHFDRPRRLLISNLAELISNQIVKINNAFKTEYGDYSFAF